RALFRLAMSAASAMWSEWACVRSTTCALMFSGLVTAAGLPVRYGSMTIEFPPLVNCTQEWPWYSIFTCSNLLVSWGFLIIISHLEPLNRVWKIARMEKSALDAARHAGFRK